MKWVDKLSDRIAKTIVDRSNIRENDHEIKGISQEIDLLRELKDQIIMRDLKIERQKIEWDRTYDSIIDNIVIIDKDFKISKANKSFLDCLVQMGHDPEEVMGMDWLSFKDLAGIPRDVCAVLEAFEKKIPTTCDVTLQGRTFSVIANPIIEDDEVIGVVRLSRDTTKEEEQKCKLERRSNIYHSISEMGKLLVNHKNWNDAVNEVLEMLGESIGASRVYVFKNELRGEDHDEHGERLCSLLQHVYHNNVFRDCTSQTISECINYDLLPDWSADMSVGKSVMGNLIDCYICPLKDRCTCVDEVIISAVPVFVGGEWWGFIGFDYMNGVRKWKDDDETLLRIAADILGGSIYHRTRYFEAVDNKGDDNGN